MITQLPQTHTAEAVCILYIHQVQRRYDLLRQIVSTTEPLDGQFAPEPRGESRGE